MRRNLTKQRRRPYKLRRHNITVLPGFLIQQKYYRSRQRIYSDSWISQTRFGTWAFTVSLFDTLHTLMWLIFVLASFQNCLRSRAWRRGNCFQSRRSIRSWYVWITQLEQTAAHGATGGYLERALEHYKRAEKHGVKKAAMHIRNVSWCYLIPFLLFNFNVFCQKISAKILGQKLKEEGKLSDDNNL